MYTEDNKNLDDLGEIVTICGTEDEGGNGLVLGSP